jgi:hypothetical protein
MVLCFFKFRPAVGQGQFSGYRELNSPPVTCWTVSCICLLLSVHFGIPRGPYIKIHQKPYSACSSSKYTDQLLLMRCLWCRPPLLHFTWIIWYFYPNIENIQTSPKWASCFVNICYWLFNGVFSCWDYIRPNDGMFGENELTVERSRRSMILN